MWHCRYSAILESKAKFDETYMKITKYEDIVFPYSAHSTVNLHAWRPRDKCYFNVLSPSIHSSSIRILTAITPEIKGFFQNYMRNNVEIGKVREEL